MDLLLVLIQLSAQFLNCGQQLLCRLFVLFDSFRTLLHLFLNCLYAFCVGIDLLVDSFFHFCFEYLQMIVDSFFEFLKPLWNHYFLQLVKLFKEYLDFLIFSTKLLKLLVKLSLLVRIRFIIH